MKTTATQTNVVVESTPQIKVSASSLGFDYESCPRCFYLDAKKDIKKPNGAFSSIFQKLEAAVRELYFKPEDGKDRNLHTIHESLPSGTIESSNRGFTSVPYLVENLNLELIVTCKLDNLVKLDDGTYAIVMFKTSMPKESNLPAIEKQINACAWAIQHCNKPEKQVKITEVGIMVFDAVAAVQMKSYDQLFSYIKLNLEPDQFENYLQDIATLLVSNVVPDFTDGCSYCHRDSLLMPECKEKYIRA
jgi:hypothetical protein